MRDILDMSPGNMGLRVEVPESALHMGPPAHTDHAAHPAVPADDTQDSSSGAKIFDGASESLAHCAREHQN
jgi:hypothetical protein